MFLIDNKMVYTEYNKCKQCYGYDKRSIDQENVEGTLTPSEGLSSGKGIGPVASQQVTDTTPGHSKQGEHKENPFVKSINL